MVNKLIGQHCLLYLGLVDISLLSIFSFFLLIFYHLYFVKLSSSLVDFLFLSHIFCVVQSGFFHLP